jgi:hypothetical protein
MCAVTTSRGHRTAARPTWRRTAARSRGSGPPDVLKPRKAIVSPVAVQTGVASVSTPVTATPAAMRRATVVSSPGAPASRAWLFATVPMTAPLSRRLRSAAAADTGCRNA